MRAAVPLLILAAVAVVVPAVMATPPGLAVTRAVVETLPGLGVLRDAQKWVALAMPDTRWPRPGPCRRWPGSG